MNLTRAILEGIHEVELEITPEFRESKKVSIWHMNDLLESLGWKQDGVDQKVHVVLAHKIGPVQMVERKWTYGDTPGMHIGARRPMAKEPAVTSTAAGMWVDHAYYWTAAWGGTPIEPLTLERIREVATELQLKHHFSEPWSAEPPRAGEVGPISEIEALDRELTKLGWNVVASSGMGAVVYEKEGVPDQLVITSEEDLGIINAAVEYEDGSSYEISPPTIDDIVAKAKHLSASAH